jgi:predicted TIM-barrel fold metal-dependent hydrolase
MLDFQMFDADNHYYEATDAFTRHLDPKLHRRAMQWATVNGKERLLVGGTINRFIPNPTFENVSKPGALQDYFRAKAGVTDMRAAFGELEAIAERPEYRDRDARIKVMDEQGIDATIMLPTLGVGMETALEGDPEACVAAFRAFNRWLDEDWGFNHLERIYGAPYITLIDPDAAVEELEYALSRDARVVLMRPASVRLPDGSRRTPGDPRHDAFWSRLDESGITLVIHGGDSSYAPYEQIWGLSGETESFRIAPLKRLLSASTIHDMMASLMADRLFERFSNLRVATIETGSGWVKPLLKRLRSVMAQVPDTFGEDPIALFQEHVWVSPFFEDDVLGLIDVLGPDRVVFGSDYPHAEGLSVPASFVEELPGIDPEAVRKIMHDNARELVTPRARVSS